MSSSRRKRKREKRDYRLQKKEEKIGKKEVVKFLDEEIYSKELEKKNLQFDAAISELQNTINDLTRYIQGYDALIARYLQTKDPQVTKNADAYSERIGQDLQTVFAWLEYAEKALNNDKDEVEDMIKALKKENDLIDKEQNRERKQFDNLLVAYKEKSNLNETKKAAILKAKKKINDEIKSHNTKIAELYQISLQIISQDLEQTKNLLNQRKDIKKKWKEQSSSWEGLKGLLYDIYNLLTNKSQFVATLQLRNRKIIIIEQESDKILKEKESSYAQKKKYDLEYDSFLVKEQQELDHEKHMNRLLNFL